EALAQEYQAAQEAFRKAYQEATTEEERQKVVQEKNPQPEKFAERFLELAEKNPKDAAALDALLWVVTHTYGTNKDSPRNRAVAMLQRDHLASAKLAVVCGGMSFAQDEAGEAFLRAVLAKNPHRDVQGHACLALAEFFHKRTETV